MSIFNSNALKLAPWSATKQKMMTKCPFAGYHAFVERSPEQHNTVADDSPMIIGNKVHKIIELVLSKFPKKDMPQMSDLVSFGRRMKQVVLKDEDITQREIDAINSMHEGTLSTCMRVLSHRFKTNAKLFVEIPVGIDKELQAADFWAKDVFYRGKIDILMVTPDGAAANIDAKTGAWPSLNAHSGQLRAYEVMIFHALKNKLFQDYNISLTSVISGLAYIANEQVLWDKVAPLTKLEGSCTQNFIKNINHLSDEVFEKKIKRGNHCDYCGYKHLCGSKRGMKKKKEKVNL